MTTTPTTRLVEAMDDLTCWCGHPTERHDAATALGHAILESLRIPQLIFAFLLLCIGGGQ